MLALILAFAFVDPPKITISKETTYITGPLRADGVVDYVASLNEPLKQIKPEDNAAVLLVKAMGKEAASEKIAADYYRLLKCDPPTEKGTYLVDFHEFLKRKDRDFDDAATAALERCQLRPWKPSQEPIIEEWLRLNEKPLAMAVEATRRSRCVAPYLSGNDPPMMIAVELGMVQGCRTVARLIAARAMRSAGEGRLEAAFEDIDALHRLATLLGREAKTIIEDLVAIALRGVAFRAEHSLALVGKPSEQLLQRRIAQTLALPRFIELVDRLDHWERLAILNGTLYSIIYGGKVLGGRDPSPPAGLDGEFIDEALRTVNRWIDQYVAAIRAKPGSGGKSVDDLERELSEKMRRARERESTFFLFRSPTPPHPRGPKAAAGERYAEVMIGLLFPAFSMAAQAKIRTIAVQRQTALVYAIALYKQKHGAYPEKLDAAELGVPAEATIDPFTTKPFVFDVKERKRRIVSAGPDGIIGPRIKPNAKNITAADRAMAPPVDDVVVELP